MNTLTRVLSLYFADTVKLVAGWALVVLVVKGATFDSLRTEPALLALAILALNWLKECATDYVTTGKLEPPTPDGGQAPPSPPVVGAG